MSDTPGPIVVGVDGSAPSTSAVRWAAAMAARLGTELIAVHALGLLAHLGGEQEPAQSHRQETERLLAGPWTEPLRAAGTRYRTELAEGNPVIGLLSVTAASGAAMVVVGKRGTGGFPGLQLGSTSHQLAQHADVPVVIVPEGGYQRP